MIVRTAVAVVLAAALLHGQGGATPPRLRFAVNMTTIESAPVFLAAEGPAGAGIVVSGGGIPLLVSGEADTATNAETQALIRSATSPNIRVVLTVAECYYRIVARRSSGIARLSDLKGKKSGRRSTRPPTTSCRRWRAQPESRRPTSRRWRCRLPTCRLRSRAATWTRSRLGTAGAQFGAGARRRCDRLSGSFRVPGVVQPEHDRRGSRQSGPAQGPQHELNEASGNGNTVLLATSLRTPKACGSSRR